MTTHHSTEVRGASDFYVVALGRDAYVDAARAGNTARFINHSCEPNMRVEKWTVGGKIRLGIFANRPIAAAIPVQIPRHTA